LVHFLYDEFLLLNVLCFTNLKMEFVGWRYRPAGEFWLISFNNFLAVALTAVLLIFPFVVVGKLAWEWKPTVVREKAEKKDKEVVKKKKRKKVEVEVKKVEFAFKNEKKHRE